HPRANPIAGVLPRFAGLAIGTEVLDRSLELEPRDHFTELLEESLDGRDDLTAQEKLDFFYVGVRMQSWQGTLASATNEIWPNLALHLCRRTLEAVFGIDPRDRLACRLPNEMLRRFGPAYA